MSLPMDMNGAATGVASFAETQSAAMGLDHLQRHGLLGLHRDVMVPQTLAQGVTGGAAAGGGYGLSSQKTLWMGDLAPWMDENFLYSLFSPTNQLLSVKMIRNKTTGVSEGYAFLEMKTHEAAEHVLQTCNGRPIPGASDMVFRLNWAAYGVGRSAQQTGEDHSLFVGDLAPDVSDLILQEYFRQFYPSVRSAKVITDVATGRSKGYGFVRFASEVERNMALTDMNGHFLSNRPIRVSLATARKTGIVQQPIIPQAPHPSDLDPTNTTLFIGGLSSNVVEEQLRAVFSQFGDIIYVKIPQGKGCGFVQFVLRASAERAMAAMNGRVLGNSAMRISWGRSSSRVSQLPSSNGITLSSFPGSENMMDANTIAVAAASAAMNRFGSTELHSSQLPPLAPSSLVSDLLHPYLSSIHASRAAVASMNGLESKNHFPRTLSAGAISSGAFEASNFMDGHPESGLDSPRHKRAPSLPASTEIESVIDGSHLSGTGSAADSFVDTSLVSSSPRREETGFGDLASRQPGMANHDMTPIFASLLT